jgi:hypothetical protein
MVLIQIAEGAGSETCEGGWLVEGISIRVMLHGLIVVVCETSCACHIDKLAATDDGVLGYYWLI